MTARVETNQSSNLYFTIFVAFIVILIAFFISKRYRKSAKTVLLTGLSDSGKTALFTKLIFNKPKKSVTSLKENEATITSFNVKFVDIPGAERLRARYWDQYRTQAAHIIFVLDSTTVQTVLRDLSEYLYVLLNDEIVYKKRVSFTIACNKQDLEGSQKKSGIRNTLERELNAIRRTRTGRLGKTSEEEEEDYLAMQPSDICFDQLGVNLIETSVNNVGQLLKLIL